MPSPVSLTAILARLPLWVSRDKVAPLEERTDIVLKKLFMSVKYPG